MTDRLKNTALFIALTPLVLLSFAIALAVVIICGPYFAWVHLVQVLRRDPRTKLKQFEVELPDQTSDTDIHVKRYFGNLIKEMSSRSNATIKTLPTKYSAWKKFSERDNDVTYRQVTYSKVLTSRHATLKISLIIEEHDGIYGKEYFSYYDGDDEAMGNNVEVEILEPQLSIPHEYMIGYDHKHAWLSMALLAGNYRVNPSTSQLWARIQEHDIWLVQYKPNGKLGLRKAYSAGRARRLWLDAKHTS